MKQQIADALKELGIKEVILWAAEEARKGPTIEFASDAERVVMTNKDFADAGL